MKFKFYALKIVFICVVVFILQIIISGFTDLFILNEKSVNEFWRFLTSIFLHGDIIHLMYNMFALGLFGSILEKLTSGKKFLMIYFVSGILANLFSFNFYNSSLGASGAIFGVIGALVVIRPLMTVWAFGLPMPIFLAGILWAFGDILGAYAFLTGNPINNTGNLAHLSGMLVGFIFGYLFREKGVSVDTNGKLRFNEDSIRKWEDTYLKA